MMCGGFGYGGYSGIGGSWGPWGLVMGGVMSLLFWVALVVLVIWVVRSRRHRPFPPDGAMDILRRRLAAGEITHDEFENTRRILGG